MPEPLCVHLSPGGECVTLIFPVVEPAYTTGPPYCMSVELVRTLLTGVGFEQVALEEVPKAELARGGKVGAAKEYLGRWRRK